MSGSEWERYRSHVCETPELGLTLDISRMDFSGAYFEQMDPRMQAAFQAMEELEGGSVANPDEGRMVGHYWLRAPKLAPSDDIRQAIEATQAAIREFAQEVHTGAIAPPDRERFTRLLVIGIGGSALGPQFVADALGDSGRDHLSVHFFDNTDPDGMERELARIGSALAETLVVVISKSGGTAETRNGMVYAKRTFQEAGLSFSSQAVAITGEGSKLDRIAIDEGWIRRFPMWDWVGGRSSETAAVGLLPAALQGIDWERLLAGAAACDEVTRRNSTRSNPAALLALMWYYATNGRGDRDMVVLPYRDRLLLFSRYLQQLVMESLGKGEDLDGNAVAQGISVYGNKGSTDQHAYVQQLRQGINNFFVTFIDVLEGGRDLEVESGITVGDYLHGFLLGTREALYESGRESISLTVERLDAFTVGVLIALYERAVGFYASLVNINAYHQPGVEAGKKAASSVLELQRQVLTQLGEGGKAQTAEELAADLDRSADVETIHHLLRRLAATGRARRAQGEEPGSDRYTGVS